MMFIYFIDDDIHRLLKSATTTEQHKKKLPPFFENLPFLKNPFLNSTFRKVPTFRIRLIKKFNFEFTLKTSRRNRGGRRSTLGIVQPDKDHNDIDVLGEDENTGDGSEDQGGGG